MEKNDRPFSEPIHTAQELAIGYCLRVKLHVCQFLRWIVGISSRVGENTAARVSTRGVPEYIYEVSLSHDGGAALGSV
jgi:hypothetical protein